MKKIENPAFVAIYEQFRCEIKLARKQPKTIDSYTRSLKRLLNYFDCHPEES